MFTLALADRLLQTLDVNRVATISALVGVLEPDLNPKHLATESETSERSSDNFLTFLRQNSHEMDSVNCMLTNLWFVSAPPVAPDVPARLPAPLVPLLGAVFDSSSCWL